MPTYVTDDLIKAARKANLYNFLLARHSKDVKIEGESLRLCDNHSVSIKKGYSGYMDFATNETGNGVDLLVNYLGYDFQDAVDALCEFPNTPDKSDKPGAPPRVFKLPDAVQGPYKNLYAYLTKWRGLPQALIQQLIDDGILYQEQTHNNMVFINPSKDFVELRGTNSKQPFHQVQFDPDTPSAFWWYKPRGLFTAPERAYICESSIDAISLYLILTMLPGTNANAGLYCSIGGVMNQKRIDAISAGMSKAGCKTFLSVDNDDAGAKCRERNPDLKVLIPTYKDWNEELINWELTDPDAIKKLTQAVESNRPHQTVDPRFHTDAPS